MPHLLARRWWALALRGLVAVLFGLLTFFIPGITLISLVLLFGFYALLDGIFDIVHISRRGRPCDYLLDRAYAVVFGIMLIALAFRLRNFRQLEV
jgi:uncharacterized membrane protein HdeD (DUF308 family)